jgi:hypothetical protein
MSLRGIARLLETIPGSKHSQAANTKELKSGTVDTQRDDQLGVHTSTQHCNLLNRWLDVLERLGNVGDGVFNR